MNAGKFNDQLDRMIAFLDVEGNERAFEIDSRANEEYNMYRGNTVRLEKKKIEAQYSKLEENTLMRLAMTEGATRNAARIKVQTLRFNYYKDLFHIVTKKVTDETKDKPKYKEILRKLMLQSFCRIRVFSTVIRVRKEDTDLAKSLLKGVCYEFAMKSGAVMKTRVDEKYFLPAKVIGGLELFSTRANLKVVNTLRFRIDSVYQQTMPIVRYYLYGVNQRRKFYT